jgi:sulfide:quinone oxidoreductase
VAGRTRDDLVDAEKEGIVPMNVVIAGGGVAALEAALALRALADERVDVELVAPETHFWYRPLSVAEPFGRGEAGHYGLPDLAAAAGASFSLGTVVAVDATRHVARTSAGAELRYDTLLLAIGATPQAAIDGALTFRGPADSDALRDLLDEAERGDVHRIAFALPWGAVWSLPLYELALMTATALEEKEVGAELSVVTPEHDPLQLFGPAGSDALRTLLSARGIALHTGAYPVAVVDGELRVVPLGGIPADRVVALPRLRGPRIDGLPQTAEGFVPVDEHGRVLGIPDVYAAGDVTAFPVKQGGIAAQQADAAAEAIAASAGASLVPKPFRPVLRGLLLTGARPRYLRHDLTRAGERWTLSDEPLWWPPAKIVGRYFAPFMADLASSPLAEVPPEGGGGLEVEIEIGREQLDRLAGLPLLDVPGEPDRHGDTGAATAGELMSTDLLTVAPEDTLGELAEGLRSADAGSALVVDGGRLIGIITSRDLVRAFEGRVHPSEARVREWMTAEPVTVGVETTAETAALLMSEHGFHHLPVVEDERPVGMLGMRSVARYTVLRAHGTPVGLGF